MDSRILQCSSLEGIGLIEFGYVHATGLPFQFSSEGGEGLAWRTRKLEAPDSWKGYWTFLDKASLKVVVTLTGEIWIRYEGGERDARNMRFDSEPEWVQSLCPHGYSSGILAYLEPYLKGGQEGFWLDIPVDKLLARVRYPLAFLERNVAKGTSTN